MRIDLGVGKKKYTMSVAGTCSCFAGIALVLPKWGAGFAMSAAGTCFCFAGTARPLNKLGRRHRHVRCRHLLMLCSHRVCPKKCGAGIAVSAAGTSFRFAGIAFIWKNGAQAFQKEGRCRGEAVDKATAVRIEGSIVCQPEFQARL